MAYTQHLLKSQSFKGSQKSKPDLDKTSLDTGISSESIGTDTSSSQKYQYVVRIPFTPTKKDEIPLRIGDDVGIWKVYADYWCFGINNTLSVHGFFPLACVSEVMQEATNAEVGVKDRRESLKM
jgi:hypothetical protein